MTINCKTYECDVSDTFITIEYDTKNKNFWIKRYYIDPIISDSNLFGILLSSMIVDMKRKSMLKIDRNPGSPSIIEPKHSIERI